MEAKVFWDVKVEVSYLTPDSSIQFHNPHLQPDWFLAVTVSIIAPLSFLRGAGHVCLHLGLHSCFSLDHPVTGQSHRQTKPSIRSQ